MTLPVIVLEALPEAMLPPVTFKPPFSVRLSPLPMVKVLLLEVMAPVTVPVPFQLPPVTPKVPLIVPADMAMTPLPVNVALPLTVPEPLKVPAVATPTVLPDAMEPLTCNVPVLIVVAPVYVLVPPKVRVADALFMISVSLVPAITPLKVLLLELV